MKSINLKSKLKKVNTIPGSVVYTGDKTVKESSIELISYDESEYTRKQIQLRNLTQLDNDKVNWINVVGVHDTVLLNGIGELLKLDKLTLEDIATMNSRPKYDKYNDYHFIMLNMLLLDNSENLFRNEQLSILIKDNIVITFQEIEGDIFDFIRDRIIEYKGRIRKRKSAYLLYTLIDSVVDQYFWIINELDKKIEDMEITVMDNSDKEQSKYIYSYRRNLMEIKTAIWPIRDIIRELASEFQLFNKDEVKYLNDVNDNIRQIMDSISTYRDLAMGLYEIHLSNISNKMNRIMTTLTIISAIFIPLTFLSSVYGMNFRFMPELEFRWGYFGFWAVCTVLFVSLVLFFRRKKWFL